MVSARKALNAGVEIRVSSSDALRMTLRVYRLREEEQRTGCFAVTRNCHPEARELFGPKDRSFKRFHGPSVSAEVYP